MLNHDIVPSDEVFSSLASSLNDNAPGTVQAFCSQGSEKTTTDKVNGKLFKIVSTYEF